MKRAILFGLLSAPALAGDRVNSPGHDRHPAPRHGHNDHGRDRHRELAYRVLYRADHDLHWRVHGTYRSDADARHATDDLRHRSYETPVDRPERHR